MKFHVMSQCLLVDLSLLKIEFFIAIEKSIHFSL
jgi:hypothetical protein